MDDIDFDPRKRIYKTTLAGITGEKISDMIEYLFKEISLLAGAKENNFKSVLPQIIDVLSNKAMEQGYKVGLEKPDYRQIEA